MWRAASQRSGLCWFVGIGRWWCCPSFLTGSPLRGGRDTTSAVDFRPARGETGQFFLANQLYPVAVVLMGVIRCRTTGPRRVTTR